MKLIYRDFCVPDSIDMFTYLIIVIICIEPRLG